MIRAHHELPRPEIRAPVTNSLDEPNELALVCRELGMLRGHGAAEERDRPSALVEDSAETRARSFAVDDECLVEVRQLEHRSRCQCVLEGIESLCCR